MLGVDGSLPWSAVTTTDRRSQTREQPGQPSVEALEIRRVASDIVAVAELRVEVHEVRKDQAAIDLFHLRSHVIHAVIIARRMDGAVMPRPANRS